MRLLLIEDDADLAAALADYLELQGADCDFAYSGEAGLELARAERYDALVLDVMLPRLGGVSVCRRLRGEGYTGPILMLTAADTTEQELQGFDAGADDYVAKPCPMPLLWARLQALGRRAHHAEPLLQVGDLRLWPQRGQVRRGDTELQLGPRARALLAALMQASPALVSRRALERAAWPEGTTSGNFNVHLHQLRKAIDRPFDTPLIHTRPGVGLCLAEEPPP